MCRAREGSWDGTALRGEAVEEAGLSTRTHETGGRRRVRVRLTTAGHAAFPAHAGSEDAGEGAPLAALTGEERRTPAGLPRKAVVAAGAGYRAPAPPRPGPRRSRSVET